METTLNILVVISVVRYASSLDPVGEWPLTDMYGDTGRDASGHGHHAWVGDVQQGETFPGTNVHVTRFLDADLSYLEIASAPELAVSDFTFMAQVKPAHSNDSPLFGWDVTNPNVFGTHIWMVGMSLFFRIMPSNTQVVTAPTFHTGIQVGKWQRLYASYKVATGEAYTCIDNDCSKVTLDTAGLEHRTSLAIRIGGKWGETRRFIGQMACVALYDVFIDDPDDIESVRSATEARCLGYLCSPVAQSSVVFEKFTPVSGSGQITASAPASSRLSCALSCLRTCCKSFTWSASTKICTEYSTIEQGNPPAGQNDTVSFRIDV